MYTLYHLPGTCSLATLTVLLELQQQVQLVHRDSVPDYRKINPAGTVPALAPSRGAPLLEGGAIMLHLLQQHDAHWQVMSDEKRQTLTQHIFFANATMHPAYGRLFFLKRNLPEGETQQVAYEAAAAQIDNLWQIVEGQLQFHPFLGGDAPSAADIMLTVYSRWAQYFPVSISIGSRSKRMIDSVLEMSSFQRAVAMEAEIQ